ncbi:MAG: hypothetical protein WBG86_09730 [Polyangiales bacterium]
MPIDRSAKLDAGLIVRFAGDGGVRGDLRLLPERFDVARSWPDMSLIHEALVIDLCNRDAAVCDAVKGKHLSVEASLVVAYAQFEKALTVLLASGRRLANAGLELGIIPDARAGATELEATKAFRSDEQEASPERKLALACSAIEFFTTGGDARCCATAPGDALLRNVVGPDVRAFHVHLPGVESELAVFDRGALDWADRGLRARYDIGRSLKTAPR